MAELNFDKKIIDPEKEHFTQVIDRVIHENYKIVNSLMERVADSQITKDELASALFSNLKLKIAEELAKELKIENPSSKEAWHEIMNNGKYDLIMLIISKKTEEIGKKWNLFKS